MTIEELCVQIDMPREATDRVMEAYWKLQNMTIRTRPAPEYAKLLCQRDTYPVAADAFVKETDGWVSLAAMLHAACIVYEEYVRAGISKEIYLDTMKCFSRFVNEHKESFGEYGFDRAFWTGRQTSMSLFRIGTLEYELAQGEISIHIPSDADLSCPSVEQSFALARDFFANFRGGEWKSARYACTSWLLSPALGQLLSENSRILRFQKYFSLERVFETEKESCILWVFRDPRLPASDFPENTSLQRTLKQYLLRGGKVGEATGILKEMFD